MSYYGLYKKRLNRYGVNPQERLELGRQENFNRFLLQSPHYTIFKYTDGDSEERTVECVFEPYKQDQTQTLMYVLCKVGESFNPGDIVTINDKRYMFYYWDERKDSGYNRWIVVKLTQPISWINEDGTKYDSEAYIYSQQDNMLKNELKSRSRSATLYLENQKLDLMLMPANKNLKIGSYLEIKVGEMERAERVTGFDFISTPGILYVSMDPTIKRDLTPAPEKTPEDDNNDYFWFGGDALNG